MADAVILLVGAGQFMFLDDTPQVILTTRGSDEADLRVAAHDLTVEIIARLSILEERTFGDQAREILFSFRIHFGRINIRAGRQVDFRLAHMKETVGVSSGGLPGFLAR